MTSVSAKSSVVITERVRRINGMLPGYAPRSVLVVEIRMTPDDTIMQAMA
jgi:hypothetical protein